MRTALLTATVLVAFSSLAVAQNQLAATAPTAKPVDPNAVVDPTVPTVRTNAPGSGRLHWMIDKPCRGPEGAYSKGACEPAPPPYRPRL